VLHQSASISEFEAISPSLFFLYIASLLICHYIIKNGVKTSGKIVAMTATSPFVFLLILLIRGLFLEGASEGLAYLFEPKWGKLWTSEIWIDAMVQVFYQLSVGIGTIYSIASMKPRR
jgi:SNF family Na+-dependent transporter